MHRLAFCKADTAQYISHLDLMRTFQRAFFRAGIPIKHTEGFHPHAFVSIPLPLSVGFSSGCEILECEILGEADLCQIPPRLNQVLPPGIIVHRCYEAVRPVRELCYVNYIVTMDYEAGAPFGIESSIRGLLEQDSFLVVKKSKKSKEGRTVDLIPLIAKSSVEEHRDAIVLDLTLRAQNPGLNPALLADALFEACPEDRPDLIHFHRRAVLDETFHLWE